MATREGPTYYDVLGVARDASAAEIRHAFQRLILEHHPDRNRDDRSAVARTAEINAAYRVLRDQRKRQAYDASLPLGATSSDDGRSSDEFNDAHAHWERADTEEHEWQAYVAQVQAELKGWTNEYLHAFVSEHAALADDAASFEERSMHQWFVAVALEEIELREGRSDAEEQEWQAYVAQVQAELESWSDEHLRAFVSEHAALAGDAASLEERNMHQWFAAVALEEIEFREEEAERERAEQARQRRERERRRREERERAEQTRRERLQREERERAEKARREQLRREERERREAPQSAAPPPAPDESAAPPHTEEHRPEGRTRRILRRLAARIGAALVVLLVQMIIVGAIGGTNPDNEGVASAGATIGVGIWMLCVVFALVLAGVDAFEKVSEVWRKRSLGVLAALIVLSIVISAVV